MISQGRPSFLILLASLSIISCGSADQISLSTNEASSFTGESLEGGSIAEIPVTDASASFSIDTSSPTAAYIVAISAYDESSQTQAYELSQSAATSTNQIFAQLITSADETEDFHEQLRELEATLDPTTFLGVANSSASAGASSAKLIKTLGVGDTKVFNILGNFSSQSSTSVTAELRYQSDNFNAFVDERDRAALSDAELSALLDGFNAVIPAERAMFGQESDVDGDGRFNILFTREVNKLGMSAGGIVTGFFYAIDLFSTAQYSQSNETEIFYTFVPDDTGTHGVAISKEFSLSNILPTVLPHEYQHMINFNEHYFVYAGGPERSFLNEGLSHLAEDIYSLDGNNYMTQTGIENPARVQGYLDANASLCFTCGASLYQRGGSYLFLRWLYEQAEQGSLPSATSGLDLLNRLNHTNLTGVSNIVNAAYGNVEADTAFSNLMGQFTLAVFLSDTGLSTDSRFALQGIRLRASQNDNRGTVLNGPNIESAELFPLNNTIAASAMSYLYLSAESLQELSGNIQLRFSSTGNFNLYVIQTSL